MQLSALDSGLGFFSCLCLIEYYVAELMFLGLDVMPCSSSSKMGCLFLVSSVHVIISSSSLVLKSCLRIFSVSKSKVF